MKKSLLFFALVLASYGTIQAQVTTSSMTGVVTQSTGHATAGATIKATHLPSGTVYSGSANVAGRFNLANMRVGGPYRVEVTYVGQDPVVYDDLYLQLGQPFVLNPVFGENATALEEVTITGARTTSKAGSVTTVNRAQIENLPSISRSVNDLTRLTPQANGTAIGGGNYRSNNFTVDGANFNNQFGIGQNIPANGSPISLDALEQIAVSVTPFDVRQSGFTGASINAVTRSGTNEFFGTAFYTFRNEKFQGKYVGDYEVTRNDLDNKQIGFSVGGPIIKDKLFFFVNGEFNPVTEPGQNRVASTPENQFGSGSDVVRPSASFLNGVRDYLINTYGYDPGEYQGYSFNSNNTKLFARIDWNINENHKLNFRYNQVEAKSPSFVSTSTSGSGVSYSGSDNRRSTNALHFSNSNYYQENNLYSGTLELNSKFGQVNNSFRAAYVKQYEPRSSDSSPFPLVDILEGNSVLTTFGYEPFTYGNLRDVETFTLNNDASYVLGNHNFTAGVQAEFSTVKNGFQRFGTGFYTFASWDDFVSGRKPTAYTLTFPMTPDGSQAFPSFKFAQYSLYLQDEFNVNERLKLTGGLRLELPTYPNVSEIQTHPLVAANTYANGEKIDTGTLPGSKIMFSPRVSFNWDAMGDRSLVLRGGTGVFTGRVPFVWIVAQSGDAGMLQYTKVFEGNEIPNFSPDITANYPAQLPPAGTSIPGSISALARDFKFPQTWKTSLALDYKLPWGIDATVEAIYNKDINAVYARNANLKEPNTLNVSGYGDNRYIFPASRFINGTHNAIVMDNTKGGHYWSTTVQLSKNFDHGLSAMVAYTRSEAKNFGDGSGDQIVNLWSLPYQNIGNSNRPTLGFTNNVIPDRIVANLSYRQEWLKNLATTVSLFYEGGIQGRFSYGYTSDFNNDSQVNDLIYVPRDASEIVFQDIPAGTSGYREAGYTAAEQAEIFFNLIDNDPYLKTRKGQYAERNGGKLPWRNQIDLRISQEVFKNFGGSKNSLSVFWDVFNFGNLLNKNWGHYNFAMGSGGLLVPRNMSAVAADPTVKPVFRMQAANGDIIRETTGTTQTISSTYYMQFGIRYRFN
ncbi:MAG TPA: TonB-dependent receptor [Sphingobacterium sp.]|nr:TonB-dependent receptor [Sphingobacterium sp.]